MPTREEALAELEAVFQLIADEYAARREPLPTGPTAIVNA
jgi:predicted RNase H-like HicB family nuclease